MCTAAAPFENSLSGTLDHLHLLRPVPKIPKGMKPLHGLSFILRALSKRGVNVAHEAFWQQDLLAAYADRYNSKNLVNYNMSMSDHQEKHPDLLHSLCCDKPGREGEHDVGFVLVSVSVGVDVLV